MKAIAAAAVAIVGAVTVAITAAEAGGADKWFVCKYTNTPGGGEQLQTGQNPISVNASAIPLSPVVAGAEFADQQGRSIVLVADTGQPEPDAGDCPPPQGGTTTTTSTSTTIPEQPTTTATGATTTTAAPPPPTFTTTTSSTTPGATTTSTTPSVTSSSSAPTTSPILNVELLEPICDGDVPYLGYSVAFGGATSVDRITFVNPDGDDFTYVDLPLAGRVLWPGAVVDADGNPLDWPGWTEVSPDVWVEGDEFDWVRPSVSVVIEVNPIETFEIEYPPSTPQCATDPPPPPGSTTTTTQPGTPPGAPRTPPPGAALPPTR